MTSSTTASQIITGVVRRILRPLFRILLRNGLSFKAFADIAKRMYVEVAMQEYGVPGKKPGISRISILSGLSRKEVQRVLGTPVSEDSGTIERYNRAARVVAGWVRDPSFGGPDGEPVALSIQDGKNSFFELVRLYSGDVPGRAVLDELLRVQAVEKLPDGRLRLLARAYVPRGSDLDKLDILGTDVADLIATIDHNLQHGIADPFFQRKVMYDNVPVESINEFRALGGKESQTLLERFDRWLSQRDRDSNPQVAGSGRVRTGLGIYYFEEKLAVAPIVAAKE